VGSKDTYHHGALKDALIAEALEALEKEGLASLSLRGLAEAAGVSKTAPYRHFPSKRDLLVALAAEGFREFADRLEASAAGAADDEPLAGVRALSRAYLDFAKTRPALYHLMFSPLGYSLHSEACRLNSERALSVLFQVVQRAQEAGWRAGQDGRSLALAVWAGVHGWASLLIDGLLPEGVVPGGGPLPDVTDLLLP
jgi:AcrR family transcriptional regulator